MTLLNEIFQNVNIINICNWIWDNPIKSIFIVIIIFIISLLIEKWRIIMQKITFPILVKLYGNTLLKYIQNKNLEYFKNEYVSAINNDYPFSLNKLVIKYLTIKYDSNNLYYELHFDFLNNNLFEVNINFKKIEILKNNSPINEIDITNGNYYNIFTEHIYIKQDLNKEKIEKIKAISITTDVNNELMSKYEFNINIIADIDYNNKKYLNQYFKLNSLIFIKI